MYFNLKEGVSEEEFIEKSKEWVSYNKGKVEGERVESTKLYRNHFFSANQRVYRMHFEFENFTAWEGFSKFLEEDKKGARLMDEWHSFMEYKTHYDEFVREIPL